MTERRDRLSKALMPFGVVFLVALAALAFFSWRARPGVTGRESTLIGTSSAGSIEVAPRSVLHTIPSGGVAWRALATTQTELLAVSEAGAIGSLFDPREPIRVDPQTPATHDLLAVAGDTNHLYAVGRAGSIASRDAKRAWSPIPCDAKEDLFAVAVGEKASVAVGAKGTVVVLRDSDAGSVATTFASGVTSDLRGVAFDGDVAIVVGKGGVALACDLVKKACTRETVPVASDLHAVAASKDSLVAVGAKGVILRRKAGAWAAEASGVSGDLYSVAYGLGMTYAVGHGGAAVYRTDRDPAWTRELTGVRASLVSVAIRLDTIYVAGSGATLFSRPVL